MTPTSEEGDETLSTMAPFRLGVSGVGRPALTRICHSTTSKLTSTPQDSLRFCWMNSFIGSGDIWPDPEVEIIALKASGLSDVKPASASSFLPLAGSNVWGFCGA